MQTNTDKIRIFKDENKNIREDKKRDKFSPKEQRKRSRNAKLSSRDVE